MSDQSAPIKINPLRKWRGSLQKGTCMEKESYLEMLKAQFRDQMHDALLHSSHCYNAVFDIESFNKRMHELYGYALAEGITTDEFFDMVGQAIPLYRNKINFSPHVTKKKAA